MEIALPADGSLRGHDPRLRSTVAIVAALNLAYFGVESTVAAIVGSVALFADSVDFLEDATVNALVLMALGWSAARRRAVGIVLAGLLLVPGLAALWTAIAKLGTPVAPEPVSLTLAGVGALAVNLACAMLLARVRASGGSLTKAAYLSARNDVVANIAIIAAGLATAASGSFLPDLVVGIAIAIMNAGAAREVMEAAMNESDDIEERIEA